MENVVNKKNGVNVDQLMGTIGAVKNDPEIADFKFRSQTEWLGGARCRTTFKPFYGAKEEDVSRTTPLVMEGDEPPVLLGENQGANPVEAVLHALGSCLSVGFVYNAAAQDIEVEELTFNIEGDLDLHGFLGLSEKTRPGYKNIRVSYNVKADAPKEQLEELFTYVKKTSPVLNILRNPVQVDFEARA